MFRTTLFFLFSLVTVTALANDQGGLLEPCINGGVSASGHYPTQQMEDLILASGAQSSPSAESPGTPASGDVAVPDDDEETCWVAPEWREDMS